MKTTHNLEFKVKPWHPLIPLEQLADIVGAILIDDDKYPDVPWQLFKVGTVKGQWRATPEAYQILSIVNDNPGNGHLDDLFEWFDHSCRRDKKDLQILSFENYNFKIHLIRKRGFERHGEDVIKRFSNNGTKD